jgi:hypothetical protein
MWRDRGVVEAGVEALRMWNLEEKMEVQRPGF